jgi:hypothetical protein
MNARKIWCFALFLPLVFSMALTGCIDELEDDETLPVITSQPASIFLTPAASSSSLTVAASVKDGNALSYQWYVNSKASWVGRTELPGETNPTYTPGTSEMGTKYYQVVVTNTGVDGAWTDSAFAQVTVFPANNLLWDNAAFDPSKWSGNGTTTITKEDGTPTIGQYQSIVVGELTTTTFHFLYAFPSVKDFTAVVAPDGDGKATKGTLHVSLWAENVSSIAYFSINLHTGSGYTQNPYNVGNSTATAKLLKEKEWVDIEFPCSSFSNQNVATNSWAGLGLLHVWVTDPPGGTKIKLKDFFIY